MPTRYDDRIASAVVAELRRRRIPGTRLNPRETASPQALVPRLASEVAAVLELTPARRRSKQASPAISSRLVAAVASQVVAALAPNRTTEDLPMEKIEI